MQQEMCISAVPLQYFHCPNSPWQQTTHAGNHAGNHCHPRDTIRLKDRGEGRACEFSILAGFFGLKEDAASAGPRPRNLTATPQFLRCAGLSGQSCGMCLTNMSRPWRRMRALPIDEPKLSSGLLQALGFAELWSCCRYQAYQPGASGSDCGSQG